MSIPDKFEIPDSPGACLKQIREDKKLSIQEVATQMFLEPRIIEALEQDNYAQLPAATYVKGYLRSYAKILNVSADPILDLYEENEPEPPEIIPEVKLKSQASSRDKPMVAFSYLILFVLLLLLFAWWRSNFSLDASSFSNFFNSAEDEPPPPSLSYEIPIVEHPESPFYRAPVTEDLLQLTQEINIVEPESTDDTTASEDSINEIDERGSGPDTVEIKLTGDSWVEVFDANDEKVYLNLARSGQTLLLHGTSPFTVLLGFSQGASVTFNGQEFDHAPFSRAGIARFTLGE